LKNEVIDEGAEVNSVVYGLGSLAKPFVGSGLVEMMYVSRIIVMNCPASMSNVIPLYPVSPFILMRYRSGGPSTPGAVQHIYLDSVYDA